MTVYIEPHIAVKLTSGRIANVRSSVLLSTRHTMTANPFVTPIEVATTKRKYIDAGSK